MSTFNHEGTPDFLAHDLTAVEIFDKLININGLQSLLVKLQGYIIWKKTLWRNSAVGQRMSAFPQITEEPEKLIK